MARIRTRPTPWPDKFDNDNYKDLRRGAADDAFWDEDELVDYHSSKKNNKQSKKHTGCPGNEYGPHIWVWTTYADIDGWDWYGSDYEIKACCGCRKRKWRGGFRKKKI